MKTLVLLLLCWTLHNVSSWTMSTPRPRITRTSMSLSSEDETEYSVTLGLPPLGIVFEDVGTGYPPKGVQVIALTSSGKGEACRQIEIGDVLKTCSAVKFVPGSANFDVVEVDCTKLDFDTVVSAITSNEEKFGCDSVSLTFTRPSKNELEKQREEANETATENEEAVAVPEEEAKDD